MSDLAAQASGSHLILYDGVCALCNGLNAFVLPRDPQEKFHFASLQSQAAHSILRRFERDPGDLNTLYVVADYRSASARLLSKSQAGLFVLAQIGGIWKLAGVLKVLPRPLRDAVYGFVARHRYRVFGRYDTCPIPSAEHKNRFIGL
jgi:predicted DCC family thiol-disulfide oxidoreductase YuxK